MGVKELLVYLVLKGLKYRERIKQIQQQCEVQRNHGMVQIVEWGGKEGDVNEQEMEFGDGELSTQGKKNREAGKSTKLTGKTNRMEEQKKKTEWGKKTYEIFKTASS